MPRLKIRIKDVNPHLTCILCGGYLINATTIIECLHSFCRSCIVKYLETNKYCPICEVQIHKTRPLLNIRNDQTLQEIVYKLVPGLRQDEMCRRRLFYATHPASAGERGDPDYGTEHVTVMLQAADECTNTSTRYLRCPTGVAIAHLKHLICAKYELPSVDIMLQDRLLSSELTLLDVTRMNSATSKTFIHLMYKVGLIKKETSHSPLVQNSLSNISDVQTCADTCTQILSENSNIPTPAVSVSLKVQPDDMTPQVICSVSCAVPTTLQNSLTQSMNAHALNTHISSTQVTFAQNTPMLNTTVQVKTIETPSNVASPSVEPLTRIESSDISIKKTESIDKQDIKIQEENKIAKTSSENKEVQLRISESGIMSVTTGEASSSVVLPAPSTTAAVSPLKRKAEPSEKLVPSTISSPHLPSNKLQKLNHSVSVSNSVSSVVKSSSVVGQSHIKKQTVVGYKTLRDPPKTWNPVLPTRPPSSPQRPPKFFKVRNNMPRYLGNPASGVKPMYQISNRETDDKQQNNVSSSTTINKNILNKMTTSLKSSSKVTAPILKSSNTITVNNNENKVEIVSDKQNDSSPIIVTKSLPDTAASGSKSENVPVTKTNTEENKINTNVTSTLDAETANRNTKSSASCSPSVTARGSPVTVSEMLQLRNQGKSTGQIPETKTTDDKPLEKNKDKLDTDTPSQQNKEKQSNELVNDPSSSSSNLIKSSKFVRIDPKTLQPITMDSKNTNSNCSSKNQIELKISQTTVPIYSPIRQKHKMDLKSQKNLSQNLRIDNNTLNKLTHNSQSSQSKYDDNRNPANLTSNLPSSSWKNDRPGLKSVSASPTAGTSPKSPKSNISQLGKSSPTRFPSPKPDRSSPKNKQLSPRTSPKRSPNMPKKTDSTLSKFNFVPPNPFMPNLTTNQLLFQSYAAMSYDPRIHAGLYHGLPLGLGRALYGPPRGPPFPLPPSGPPASSPSSASSTKSDTVKQ